MPILNDADRKKFPADLCKNLVALAHRGKLDGLTRDVHMETRRLNPGIMDAPNTVSLPSEVLREAYRGLTANVYSAGGAFIESTIGGADPLPLPVAVLRKAGARTITAPAGTGGVQIPIETDDVTGEWLSEGEAITDSTGAFGSANSVPFRYGAATKSSVLLDVQTGGLSTAFAIGSLLRGRENAIDRAGLIGTGVNGEPLGIYRATGVPTVTFSGAATLAKALEFEAALGGVDVPDENITFIAHPEVREKWKAIQRWTGASVALWSDDDKIAGRPAMVTTNIGGTDILAVDGTKVVLVEYGVGSPLSLSIDPFTDSMSDRIRIVLNAYVDVILTRRNRAVINSGSVIQ